MKIEKLNKLIENTRLKLGETQKEFGARFGNNNSTVSGWENGKREARYEVIEFCLLVASTHELCPSCKGKGYLLIETEQSPSFKKIL